MDMITFQFIHPEDKTAFELLAQWDNNLSIAHLHRPNFDPNKPLPLVTAEQLQLAYSTRKTDKWSYFICSNGVKVGVVSIERHFFALQSTMDAAWMSICIGETAYQGRGIGKQALCFIEEIAKNHGFQTIELGVFAYNHFAKVLYERSGYEQLCFIHDFVYYEGQSYADIRYIKHLK